MVVECCRLRRVPLAIEILSDNPLVEGTWSGDLLSVVSRVDNEFWRQHPELTQQLKAIAQRALSEIEDEEIIGEEVMLWLKQQ